MATLGYSSLFSSGLLAPEFETYSPSRPQTPDPSTPRSRTISIDDTTPTAPTQALPATPSSNNTLPSLVVRENVDVSMSPTIAERPRMRRRRSSLGLSASPVATIKCNTNSARVSASIHIQRQSLSMAGVGSPGRPRAGSVAETGVLLSRAAISIGTNDATVGNSLMGRLRSGSLGTILRFVEFPPHDRVGIRTWADALFNCNFSPRRMRKQATLPAPTSPPPSIPLPPLPPSCLPLPTLNLPPIPQTPRRPLSRRSQTADSIPLPLNTPTMPYTPSEKDRSVASLDMDVDPFEYSRPLDSPGRVRGGYF